MHIPDLQQLIPTDTSIVRRLQSLVSPAINHLLTTDPHAQGRLRAHAGKTLVFSALGMDLPFEISPDGLLRTPQDSAMATDDAHLHITLDMDALRDALARRAPLSLSGARVRGDAELAQTLSWLMAHVRWDAEDDLAQLIGDIPAHRLAQAGQAAATQGRQAWERGHARARDWFATRPRALVSRSELTQQQDAVRDLRDRTARLEKRIALLRKQIGANRR
ncbi:MAG: ubiquinone biosynthesis accessory factor UbiJ [Thiomonas sp.]